MLTSTTNTERGQDPMRLEITGPPGTAEFLNTLMPNAFARGVAIDRAA